jgi:hypothetical protein
MCVVLSQSPAIPGSKSISPTVSSTLSTSLPSNQGVEYSPRDPLFNPSSIPPEDWQSYPNIAQLFGVSTRIYSNAVASSSKVTLERAHNSRNALDSVNTEPGLSVRALEKSPTPAHGINGTSHRMLYNPASTEDQSLGMHYYPMSYVYRCNWNYRSGGQRIYCFQQSAHGHVPITLKWDIATVTPWQHQRVGCRYEGEPVVSPANNPRYALRILD